MLRTKTLSRPKYLRLILVWRYMNHFLSDGFVSLNGDFTQSTPITILRDTEASQSLILADTLPFSEKTSSETSVLIQSVECGFVTVPLHNIFYAPKELRVAYLNRTVRPSVRLSVRPSVRLSVRPSVSPSVRYKSCLSDIS